MKEKYNFEFPFTTYYGLLRAIPTEWKSALRVKVGVHANPFTPTPVEELVTINQKLAASLERQSLPNCHPEIFAGDVTLFHPWKSAFGAMVKDANLSPEKEINYLRSYTKGDAQKVVNNVRQRQYRDPVVALRDVWTELERRFGNTAAITNVLVQRLQHTSRFEQGDSFRDLQTCVLM